MREKDLTLTEINKFCLSQTCPRFDTIDLSGANNHDTALVLRQCKDRRLAISICRSFYRASYALAVYAMAVCLSVCVCLCPVSYTHLTLPTNREV